MNSTHLGDITKNSIEEAWNGREAQKVRQLISKGKYKDAGCKPGCPVLYRISSGKTMAMTPPKWREAAEQNVNFQENLHSYENSLRAQKKIVASYPIVLDIQPTETCNMRCIMCHQQHHKRNKIAPYFINKLFKYRDLLYSVRFQGGEIFLDADFAGFLVELKNSFLPYQSIEAITNGSRLSFEQLEMMTDGPNPIRFIVSMDGTNEKTYRAIRKSTRFTKVMSTIKYLSEVQHRKKLSNMIQWNFVIMRSNFYQIEPAIKLAAKLKIRISFQPIIGPYTEENIFEYPELRNENDLSYIQDCVKTAQTLEADVINLATVEQKLI